ncbi:hypothetical protein, partial [Roseisolibacter sp. H3M3-2]|uniref:hypothetical protein n=1 Tax=Roseisolibacter sp. H3M3-2 TaxID=3031323 RepID=UPI0023DCD670
VFLRPLGLRLAYGAGGAAAARDANAAAAVSHVLTVGTPWSDASPDAPLAGALADAVRFLARLVRPGIARWPEKLLAFETTPLVVTRLRDARAEALRAEEDALPTAEAATGALPSAAAEPRRAGLVVRAAFGRLGADAGARGLAALFADGLSARVGAERAAVAPGPITALHVGADVPVLDLDLGGLLVGAGATLELASVTRDGPGDPVELAGVRGVRVDVHLGVHDGWLVGGPGAAQRDVEVRWMSAHVRVPLDGREARADDVELVLHEARAFSTYRERWTVRADAVGAGADVTGALPEVKVLLSQVVARLRAASTPLGTLLEVVGLVRDAGLDPAALDRLLHDARDFAATAMADAAALAAALLALAAAAVLAALAYVPPPRAHAAVAALALLRAAAVTLLGARALDALRGRSQPDALLVALDASASWTRATDSSAFRAAADSARALADDTLWLFGDSLRAGGGAPAPA